LPAREASLELRKVLQLVDHDKTTLLDSAFQILVVAAGEARLPIVDSLKDGTPSWLVEVDGCVPIHSSSN